MKVLLVDDHHLFRAGLSSLLEAWSFLVVGEANSGEEAIVKARELHPELIFMDIKMAGLNGIETTRAVKSEFPDIKVIILTVADDENDLFEAIKSGADGYLLKNTQEDQFAELVNRIKQGEPVISPSLAKKLLKEFARLKQEAPKDRVETGLTQREEEVLEHVIKGATNKEIAAALYISENTINYHMKNILGKLHLRNRAQVISWSLGHGYHTAGPHPD